MDRYHNDFIGIDTVQVKAKRVRRYKFRSDGRSQSHQLFDPNNFYRNFFITQIRFFWKYLEYTWARCAKCWSFCILLVTRRSDATTACLPCITANTRNAKLWPPGATSKHQNISPKLFLNFFLSKWHQISGWDQRNNKLFFYHANKRHPNM